MGTLNRRLSILGVLALAGVAGIFVYFAPHPSPDRALESAPAETSFQQFQQLVLPVLERRCNGCHGLLIDEYEIMELASENRTLLRWVVDESGRVDSPETQAIAFERCTTIRRSTRRTLQPIDYSAPAVASSFVRVPLAERYSGSVGHPEIFGSLDDPDCQTVLQWVQAEIAAHPVAPQAVPEAERFFGEEVTPILMRKTCFGVNCHGKQAFNDLKLDPGIPALEGRFTAGLIHKNRLAMLGTNTRMVHLSGDVAQSKQLLKNIPVEQGGIVHKGGNNFFEKGDPDFEVLRHWLELEAGEARRRTGHALGETRGIVFVRRPRATPERFFEDDRFLPGGDLFWRRGEQETNLTAALHPGGPADIRAPDVSYDGSRVVFAMRRSAAEPFNLWEIAFEGGAARQLTFSRDPAVHYMDPLYVPDPSDKEGNHLDRVNVVFVSNAAGGSCESSPSHLLGEAEGGTRNIIRDAQRTEKAGTFDGSTLRIVRGTNIGETRRIKHYEPGQILVDFPFAQACDSSTHYVIEVEGRIAPRYDAYRLPLSPPGQEKWYFETLVKRMTYSPSQIRRPTMRSSGEIMFTSLRTGWQDDRPFFNGALFRTFVDGSNFHTHNANRSGVPIHSDDREMPNGLEIRIGRDADSWWGGALLLSDHQFGPTIEAYNPLDNLDHPYRDGPPKHAEHRFVPGWISLDPDVAYRGVSPGGAYRDPYPMPDGSVLVAYAAGPVDLADATAAPNFDIIRLYPSPAFQSPDGFEAGAYRREVVVGSPQSELWPRPVVARLKEPVGLMLKQELSLFGKPTVTQGYPAYPDDTPAVVQVFDLPLLDVFFEQSTPVGVRPIAAPVCPSCPEETDDRDTVRFLRIVGVDPDREHIGNAPRRFLLAEAPIEADGSVYVAIPSGIGFDLQSLNGDRMALRSPNRWLYCLPGEKHTLSIPRTLYPQTCSGCHGGLSGRPADTLRRPDAVTSASRTLSVWNENRKQLPRNWTDQKTIQTTRIDVAADLRPVIEQRCMPCHSGEQPGADLTLSDERTLDNLCRYVAQPDGMAIKSYLMEKLMGRELRAKRDLDGESPHPADDPLSDEELLKFIRWIDLGAQT